MEKDLMNFEHRWKLLDWIDEKKLEYYYLSQNPRAMYLLEKNFSKINLRVLQRNPSALYLFKYNHFTLYHNSICFIPIKTYLKDRLFQIFWGDLATNESSIHIFKKFMNQESSSDFNFFFNFKDFRYAFSTNVAAIEIVEENIHKVHWGALSTNPAAIHILEQNQDKIIGPYLCENPAAIHLLEENPDDIDWNHLSLNYAAIHLLEQNFDRINWECLSSNKGAIHLLEQNPDKISWLHLSKNPAAIHLLKNNQNKIDWSYFTQNISIFELDYDFFKKRMDIIRYELMEKTWYPQRYRDWCLSIQDLI